MSTNSLTIPIGLKEPAQYAKDLHSAISEIKMLVFERRELDLSESQTFALHLLSDLQQRLVE